MRAQCDWRRILSPLGRVRRRLSSITRREGGGGNEGEGDGRERGRMMGGARRSEWMEGEE
jgi:hypothetical protein